jgi:hypothetical protein
MLRVGRNDHPATRNFGEDQFRRNALHSCNLLHLWSNNTLTGIMHLGYYVLSHKLCWALIRGIRASGGGQFLARCAY